MHADVVRGVATGNTRVSALFSRGGESPLDDSQGASHAGELTFAGALPGNLLEDSDMHCTPCDLAAQATAPYGMHACLIVVQLLTVV